MPKLIKNGEIATNEWTLLDADADISALSSGQWVLPLPSFLSLAANGEVDYPRIGVCLASDDDVSVLEAHMPSLQLIVLNFNAFADGRSFSQARILRDHMDYAGEIRAVGNFLQDQLFYLSRCGVDAFLINDEINVDSALSSLRDFSETYQAACDEPQPLFRRRV